MESDEAALLAAAARSPLLNAAGNVHMSNNMRRAELARSLVIVGIIDVLALVTVRATRSYLATGRNEQRSASFACAYRD